MYFLAQKLLGQTVASIELTPDLTNLIEKVITHRPPRFYERLFPSLSFSEYVADLPSESGEATIYRIKGRRLYCCGQFVGILENKRIGETLRDVIRAMDDLGESEVSL